MSTFDKLRETMAVTFNVPADQIGEGTRQDDLGSWDSLGHINLMVALETTFDLTLDVEDFARLTSVPAILSYLEAQ